MEPASHADERAEPPRASSPGAVTGGGGPADADGELGSGAFCGPGHPSPFRLELHIPLSFPQSRGKQGTLGGD